MATHAWDTGGKERDRSAFDELAEIAHRVQTFANASALTIGLRVGNTDEIVCCARSGPKAEDVGAIMAVVGNLARLCIQSGKGLLCDDTETDVRVDLVAVRALGIRSMVVTPVKEDSRVVAVLAVFAPFANAFTGIHLAVMKTSAEQIAAFLQKTHRTPERDYEPAPSLAPVVIPKAVAALVEPMAPPVIVVEPIAAEPIVDAAVSSAVPVAVKPAAPSPAPESRTPAIAAPELSNQVRDMPRRAIENSAAFWSGSAPAASKIQPVTTVLAEDVKPAVLEVKPVALPPVREEKIAKPKQNRDIFSTLNSQAVQSRKSRSRLIVGVAAVVVIGVGAAVAVVRSHHAAPPAVAQRVQEAPNHPAPVQIQATDQPVAITVSSESSPAPVVTAGIAGNSAITKPAAANNAPVTIKTSLAVDSQSNSAEGAKKPNKAETKTSAVQIEKPALETVALANGPSKITARAADSGQQETGAPPALTVGGNTGLGKLSALSGSNAAPRTSVTTQSTMEPIQVLKRVSPIYPSYAKTRGTANADVVVLARVGKDGKVNNLQLINGPAAFRDAAFVAIKQWLFKPASLNGQPIEQDLQIRVKFEQ